MDRTKAWNRMWLLGAAPLAVASIVGGGIVFAGSDNPVTGALSAITAQQSTATNDYVTELAKNLGVSEQSLRDAIKKTDLSFLDKAVAEGKLTRERADEIRVKIESGEKSFAGLHGFERGGKGGPGGGHGGPDGAGMHAGGADLAAFLGITEDALRTEMTSGKTLAQVAETHGKTRDQLKAFLTAEQKEHLAEAVAAGKLTQAQADQKLAEMAARLDEMIDSTKPAGGPGARGGRMPGGMTPGGMAPGSMAPGRMGPGGAAPSTTGQN